MSSFCSKCGIKTLLNARFCGVCGNALASSAEFSEDTGRTTPQTFNSESNLKSNRLNNQVRSLFVIGAKAPRESEIWLKTKFPNSRVIRFSTIGAIREASRRMFELGEIASLCLMGTAQTVPTGRLHEADETTKQQHSPFWSVETDLLYVESDILLHELPSPQAGEPSNFLQRINSRVIEGGILPLGRIPSDDITFWQSYFDSLDSFKANPVACVAITNYPQIWMDETRAALAKAKDFGCMNQSLYRLDAPDGSEMDADILDGIPDYFVEGSRIIVNLHGGLPQDNLDVQEFSSDSPSSPFRLTSFKRFPQAILYLFSCYGGNSGWWRSGGVIPHFLGNGGVAAVASSTISFVSQLGIRKDIVGGSALMCAEFFKNIDAGLTFGDALKAAKMKTFMAALNDLQSEPILFCRAIKEIFQYSLFGAPWGVLNSACTSVENESGSSSGILGRVRARSTSNTISAVRAGSEELNKIRKQLNESLGDEGVKYFSRTSSYVMDSLSKNGALESLSNELSLMGYDISHAIFDSVRWADHHYNLVTLRSKTSSKQVGMLLILDDSGNLIAKMEAKG